MPPKIKRVSKYALGKTLGQGTFGKVKYAVDTETNQPVALKIMDKAKIKSAKMGPQIKKEIRVLKTLNHPTCVKLIEVLASSDNIFLVMELVSGGELFDRVVANGRFSEAEARKYFVQLIEGLEHCHSQGIAHRDLKPENLLLDANLGLKITDFGLASINDNPSEPQILHTPCGTPNFVSPEVLMEKGYDGCLADIWSAGVILYLLVSGFLPFDEPQMVDLFRKIVVADYQYPSWLSHEVQQLIGRMLEPNVERRATIQEIKDSPWFRGCKSTPHGKLKLVNTTASNAESVDQDIEDMSHIIDLDDDRMIFGADFGGPGEGVEANTENTDIALVLKREYSGRMARPTSPGGCSEANRYGYQFKFDENAGREQILVQDQWRDIREWFWDKYPGKRSVIDEKVRKERRAARKAAAATAKDLTMNVGSSTIVEMVPPTPANTCAPPFTTSSHEPETPRLDFSTVGEDAVLPNSSSATSAPSLDQVNSNMSDVGVLIPSNQTPTNSQCAEEEDEHVGPKQLNAFDLINMVSGQSVNNMLLFNSGNHPSNANSPNQTGNLPTPSTKPGGVGIVTSTDGDVAQIKNQLKQTQTNHQQQSFTQFTCKCPASLLIKRLDYVLLHIPHVKYRINYKKCHINVVWTNVRNSHQVHEFIEIYALTPELHMVRCQRMNGSVIAHGEFYRIFRDNVKYLDQHSTITSPTALQQPRSCDIVVYNNHSTSEKDARVTPTSPSKACDIIITEADIDAYLLQWSNDVLIYKDYAEKKHLQKRMNEQMLLAEEISKSNSTTTSAIIIASTSSTTTTTTLGTDSHILSASPSPQQLTTTNNTSPSVGNLTQREIELGLNNFRSLSLQNRKSIALKNQTTGSVRLQSTTAAPTITLDPTKLQTKKKAEAQSSSTSEEDDDSSSSSEEDE